MDLLKPSYATGYAKNASQSAHPNLWDGLVGAWMPSFGVTGETLRDVSGNGNHGTLTGMDAATDWVATSKGLALDFDGSNDYVDVGNEPSLQITKQITLSAWVRGVPQSNKGIVGKYASSVGQRGYLITAQQASPSNRITWYYQRFAGSFTSDFITSSSVVLDGDWHFIACSFVSSVYARIYVDGVLDVSSTTNIASGIANNSASFSIGTHNSTAQCFSGNISSVSAYNRALSPTEIKQLYVDSLAPFRRKRRVSVAVPAAVAAATKVGSIKKPTTIIKPSYQAGYARNASESENPNLWDGLVGAWMPSLGVTGGTLRDVSGNGNHGTLTNMDAASDWVTSRNSKALNYDGSVQRVQIDAANCLSFPQQDFSISVWIKSQGLISSSKGILTKGDSLTSGEFTLHTYSNLIVLRLIDVTTGAYMGVQTATLTANEWHHIVAISDKTETVSGMRIFKNGVDQNATAASGGAFNSVQQTTKPLKIAARANHEVFVGDISDLLVYKKLLSPSEIKHLYVDSLAPFRRKQRVSVAVPAAVAPSATYHPLRSLAHPLEQ